MAAKIIKGSEIGRVSSEIKVPLFDIHGSTHSKDYNSKQTEVSVAENGKPTKMRSTDDGNDSYYTCWWEQEGYMEEGWRRISRCRELQLLEEERMWRIKYCK